MIETLCQRAFFRFELQIRYAPKAPALHTGPHAWDPQFLAPPLTVVDGHEPIGDVYWAWNEDGFYALFDVPNRGRKPRVDTTHWWKGDGVRLCIDTRDARDNKRATRFCHFFYLLPAGGGPKEALPVAGTHRMSRAKEPPPPVDVSKLKVHAEVGRTGYWLSIGIPAPCLTGWDPAEHPRIGIFYKIKDTVLGSQHLTVDDELGWNADPSTWATGVLAR